MIDFDQMLTKKHIFQERQSFDPHVESLRLAARINRVPRCGALVDSGLEVSLLDRLKSCLDKRAENENRIADDDQLLKKKRDANELTELIKENLKHVRKFETKPEPRDRHKSVTRQRPAFYNLKETFAR